jgi:very-short-patch-repair endonuclease
VGRAGGRLGGYVFRREVEILGWFADFYCAAGRLVVEVDGSQHRQRRAGNRARDEAMRDNRCRVLRIPAWTVFNDLPVAVERVRVAVDTPWAHRRQDKFPAAGPRVLPGVAGRSAGQRLRHEVGDALRLAQPGGMSDAGDQL